MACYLYLYISNVKPEKYEATAERLELAEKAIEDLRSQLDTAEGAEQMLEDLTEQLMNQNEQIEELKATVEDLESLRELNDELEINHVETEKQMQEEIDYKDLVILDQKRRIDALDAAHEEAEYTIKKFRDLVMSLQRYTLPRHIRNLGSNARLPSRQTAISRTCARALNSAKWRPKSSVQGPAQ